MLFSISRECCLIILEMVLCHEVIPICLVLTKVSGNATTCQSLKNENLITPSCSCGMPVLLSALCHLQVSKHSNWLNMLTNLSVKTLCQKGENWILHSNKAQKFAGGGDGAADFIRLHVRPVFSASQERHGGKIQLLENGAQRRLEMDSPEVWYLQILFTKYNLVYFCLHLNWKHQFVVSCILGILFLIRVNEKYMHFHRKKILSLIILHMGKSNVANCRHSNSLPWFLYVPHIYNMLHHFIMVPLWYAE